MSQQLESLSLQFQPLDRNDKLMVKLQVHCHGFHTPLYVLYTHARVCVNKDTIVTPALDVLVHIWRLVRVTSIVYLNFYNGQITMLN